MWYPIPVSSDQYSSSVLLLTLYLGGKGNLRLIFFPLWALVVLYVH